MSTRFKHVLLYSSSQLVLVLNNPVVCASCTALVVYNLLPFVANCIYWLLINFLILSFPHCLSLPSFIYSHSLIASLSPSFIHLLSHFLISSLPRSLTPSFTAYTFLHFLIYFFIHWLIHSLPLPLHPSPHPTLPPLTRHPYCVNISINTTIVHLFIHFTDKLKNNLPFYLFFLILIIKYL